MISLNGHEISFSVRSEVLACVNGHKIGKIGIHLCLGNVYESDDLAAGGVGILLEVTVEVSEVIFFCGVGKEGADILEIALLDINN